MKADIVQGDVRFREHDHTYIHVPTNTKLASVTKVINTIYSPKSWDNADPAVVENARVRGEAVDRYISEYIREGRVQIEGESPDVQRRVVSAVAIFEEQFAGLPAESQVIVHSLEDGVAGMMDVWVNRKIVVDLKNTYSIEKSWILQIGAYAEYAPEPPERAGIIHINPKIYKNGGMWIEYDVGGCRRYYRKAVEWWKETQKFTTKQKEK